MYGLQNPKNVRFCHTILRKTLVDYYQSSTNNHKKFTDTMDSTKIINPHMENPPFHVFSTTADTYHVAERL